MYSHLQQLQFCCGCVSTCSCTWAKYCTSFCLWMGASTVVYSAAVLVPIPSSAQQDMFHRKRQFSNRDILVFTCLDFHLKALSFSFSQSSSRCPLWSLGLTSSAMSPAKRLFNMLWPPLLFLFSHKTFSCNAFSLFSFMRNNLSHLQ